MAFHVTEERYDRIYCAYKPCTVPILPRDLRKSICGSLSPASIPRRAGWGGVRVSVQCEYALLEQKSHEGELDLFLATRGAIEPPT